MKTYNSNIENGIKSAFYTLQTLVADEKIHDNTLSNIIKELDEQIVRAQKGDIDNSPLFIEVND